MKFLSLQLLVQFSRDFDETFQLLLSLDVSQRDYSNEFVCPSLHLSFPRHNLVAAQFSRDFDETFQLLLSPDIIRRNYRDGLILQSVHQSVCPSVDTVLSPQLLWQFSRDFDETFQLLFPWPKDDHILSRSCCTDFYQSYFPLLIFF